ncbi:hypothetical protein BKI52_02105 [marine bacterium AO1-C]|nr:hypothetical protein BKI52_02105 [marine bacterium AO1-C]
MTHSEENLQKYLKKAQEVLNSKTENYLSEKDLNDIAKSLGLNIQEIAQARKDYLTRGNTHLKFDNLDEAIGEFEQLLLLSPNHSKGLMGLAEAHLKKWQQHHKKTDKEKAQEYANQCIEVAPEAKRAYAIISELKQKPQAAPQKVKSKPATSQKQTSASRDTKKSKNKSKKQPIRTWLVVVCILIMGVIAYRFYQKNKHHTYPSFTHSLKVGSTPEGLVLWQVQSKPDEDPPHKRHAILQIGEAATGELLQEIELPSRNNVYNSNLWYYAKQFNQDFYDLHKGSFVARDVRTGEITNNKVLLENKFPALSEGISRISPYSGDWLKIITQRGANYLFFPPTKKLVPIRLYGYGSAKSWQHVWARVSNPTNGNQHKIVLTKMYRSIRHIYTHKRSYLRYRKTSLQRGIAQGRFKLVTPIEKANYFLWPEFIYADSTHTIFRYKADITKPVKYRLACIDRSGSVVWEKGKDDLDELLFKALVSSNSLTTFARHKNTLGVSSSDVTIFKNNKNHRYQMAFGLDLRTGQILWKYSPQYYKSKFKEVRK